jgi:hypothetical protein
MVAVSVKIDGLLIALALERDGHTSWAWTNDLFRWNRLNDLHYLYNPSAQLIFACQVTDLQVNIEVCFHGAKTRNGSIGADAVFSKGVGTGFGSCLERLDRLLEAGR